VNQVTEKGKLLERAGRKITGLKPPGQGSGIAEVSRSFGELGEIHGEFDRLPKEPGGVGNATGAEGFGPLSNHIVKKERRK
jgi:hypothetical protein